MVNKMATSRKSKKSTVVSSVSSVSSNDQVWMEINKSLTKYIPVEKQEEVVDNEVLSNEENEMIEVDEFEVKVRELVKQTSWQEVYMKLTEKSINVKSGSKMEKCVDIYKEMFGKEGVRRIDIIKEFMSQQDMSKEGASTYYQTISSKMKKSTGQ